MCKLSCHIFRLATVPLSSMGFVFDGAEKQSKTIPGPIRSLPEMENSIGSAVRKVLCYRQKTLLLYIIGYAKVLILFIIISQWKSSDTTDLYKPIKLGALYSTGQKGAIKPISNLCEAYLKWKTHGLLVDDILSFKQNTFN